MRNCVTCGRPFVLEYQYWQHILKCGGGFRAHNNSLFQTQLQVEQPQPPHLGEDSAAPAAGQDNNGNEAPPLDCAESDSEDVDGIVGAQEDNMEVFYEGTDPPAEEWCSDVDLTRRESEDSTQEQDEINKQDKQEDYDSISDADACGDNNNYWDVETEHQPADVSDIIAEGLVDLDDDKDDDLASVDANIAYMGRLEEGYKKLSIRSDNAQLESCEDDYGTMQPMQGEEGGWEDDVEGDEAAENPTAANPTQDRLLLG